MWMSLHPVNLNARIIVQRWGNYLPVALAR